MTNEVEMKGFQDLTDEEAVAVDGGRGIASFWVQYANGITNAALGGLPRYPGIGLAQSITSTVLNRVASGLFKYGL